MNQNPSGGHQKEKTHEQGEVDKYIHWKRKYGDCRKRMNDGNGGLSRHSTGCTFGIDLEKIKLLGQEEDTTQKKIF